MIKRVISIILAIAIGVLLLMGFTTTYTQNHSGDISAVCANLTSEDKEYIRDKFGDCKTVEELLVRVNKEICTQYTYYKRPFYIQHFNFREFITEKKGLCFDFSCYLKCIVKTLYPSIDVFVCDVRIDVFNAHSYNFVVTDEKTYYVDLTDALYDYTHDLKCTVYEDLGDLSFEEYAATYGEKIMNLH